MLPNGLRTFWANQVFSNRGVVKMISKINVGTPMKNTPVHSDNSFEIQLTKNSSINLSNG